MIIPELKEIRNIEPIELVKIGSQSIWNAGPVYEPETVAYFQHQDVNILNDETVYYGGTVQETTGQNLWTALNNFVVREKANGRWPKVKYLRPRIGGTALSHSLNMVDVNLYRGVYYGSWIHDHLGSWANGTNCYMNAFFDGDAANLHENIGISLTFNTTAIDGYRCAIGIMNGNTNRLAFHSYAANDASGVKFNIHKSYSEQSIIIKKGAVSGNRFQGVVTATLDGVNHLNYLDDGLMPTGFVYEGAQNWESSLSKGNYHLGSLGITAVHSAFTEAEQIDFTNSLNQLEIDLNRGNNW